MMNNTRSHDGQQRIVKAARDLFFDHGLSDVSTDMLAKKANVSKTTLYKHFADKNAILAAVIDAETARIFHVNAEIPDDQAAYCEYLAQFGYNLLELLSDPVIVRFDQLILSQAIQAPEITAFFFNYACDKTYDYLAYVITHGQKLGFLQSQYPAEKLAEVLISAWKGKIHERAMYGVGPADYGDLRGHVELVLKIVLEIR